MSAVRLPVLAICLIVLIAAVSLLQVRAAVSLLALNPVNLLRLLYRHGLFAEAGAVADALVQKYGADLSPSDRQALRTALGQTIDYETLAALVVGATKGVLGQLRNWNDPFLSVDLSPLKDSFVARLAVAGAGPQLLLGARFALSRLPERVTLGPSELAMHLPPTVRRVLAFGLRAGVLATAASVLVILWIAGGRAGLRWVGLGLLLSGIGLVLASTQLDYILAAAPTGLGLEALAVSPDLVAKIRAILGAAWRDLVTQAWMVPAVCAAVGAAVSAGAGLLGARRRGEEAGGG